MPRSSCAAGRHLASVCSVVSLALVAAISVGCQNEPTKEEVEAAKNTIDCERAGERIVIRFADGEARLLMPDATRVVLYQVPIRSGVRYINGLMDLHGKGLDFELTREQTPVRMTCKPYEIPKAK